MRAKTAAYLFGTGLVFVWGLARSAEPESPAAPSPALAAEVALVFQPPTTPGTGEPGRPTTPGSPAAPSDSDQRAAAAAAEAAAAARTDVANLPRGTSLRMLGDLLGIPGIGFGQPGTLFFPPGTARAAILPPSIRSFKIADDQSPQPQDRVYLDFNYFDDVNESVNRRAGTGFRNMQVYRETFGVEKTFLDHCASVGLRLPLNSLTADNLFPGNGADSTDIGDLTLILKYALWEDRDTGDLFSLGLAVTAPTGPDAFAGFDRLASIHDTAIQPYFGYIWHWDDFYFHGFTALDVPTDSRDVTMLYNDLGVGYYLYRSEQQDDRGLTALAPTFEVHVNTPLNHRGVFRLGDEAGTADLVDLTAGMTLEFNHRATLVLAAVTPVTGPKPFDFEIVTQLNVRFGKTGR